MADTAPLDEPCSEPGRDEIMQAVMSAAELCAAAVNSLAVRGGPRAVPALLVARAAVTALRDLAAVIREQRFDEAVIEAERARAAVEALAAAGLIPEPRPPYLHAV